MKTWTFSELKSMTGWLKPLVGARLQEVITQENDVMLGFYSADSDGLLWLWIDLNPIAPSLIPWPMLPASLKNKKSPVQLFLRAHFVNHVLVEVGLAGETGRVLKLTFAAHRVNPPHEIEIQLIPHTRNLIARAGDKKIAWQKPTALKEIQTDWQGSRERADRDLTTLRNEWLEFRKFKTKEKLNHDRGVASLKSVEKEIERKTKALKKVEEELERKKSLPWKQVGEWLKQNQSLDVPKEWAPFVDARRKLSWNIEQCFTKGRELEGKLQGTEQRISALKSEIEKLKASPDSLVEKSSEKTFQPFKNLEAQGRTLRLDGDITVIAGKNAQDNLKLLRKARAWDLWFHLRDRPGRHAILFRNKKQVVSDQDLQKVALWFLRQELGPKFSEHKGERFSIIVAECRHVHPIKGDKIGRVTYRDERTFICHIPT